MISARGIMILGVLTLIALTLALLIHQPASPPQRDGDEPLVSGLHDQINDVTAIEIVGPDGATVVSLRRERERWRVQEREGYEADYERVHGLLRALAIGQRASPRTANPAWHGRLGVADPGQPEGRGMLVRFPGADLPSLIVGRPESAGQGNFVRVEGEEQSWLSDRMIELSETLSGWLERSVMDIPAGELAEVTILHPDGDRIELKAADADGDLWVLMNVPDGRDAAESWRLRPVANGLANVSLEDVASAGELPEDAIRALYVTRDGLNFVASLFEVDGTYWVHFTVSAEMTAAADDDEPDDAVQSLLIDAAAVDQRLSPWRFQITSRKYETMTRRLEDLLKPGE